jgi:maltose O-acetyltransferase
VDSAIDDFLHLPQSIAHRMPAVVRLRMRSIKDGRSSVSQEMAVHEKYSVHDREADQRHLRLVRYSHRPPAHVVETMMRLLLDSIMIRQQASRNSTACQCVSTAPAVSPQSSAPPPGGRRWHLRWAIVRAVVGVFPPFSLMRVRRLALRSCGLRAGKATIFGGLPKFRGPGSIAARLRIGSYCGFNDGCVFDFEAPITIGDHVSVGHEVSFLTSVTRDGSGIGAPITIGDGVWLGARCRILAGVNVGAGSVIGAGMTVAEDVPPNTLLSGAKPISLAKWR